MKKLTLLVALMLVAAVGATAQTATTTQTTNSNQSTNSSQTSKSTKRQKAPKTATPQTDDGVQQCITQRLAAAPKLGKDNLQASVSGGVATLTGNVPDPGSKGGAGSIAKRCGAKSVVNNITFTAKPKTPKAAKQPKNSNSNTNMQSPTSH